MAILMTSKHMICIFMMGSHGFFPLGDFDCTPDGSCPMPDPFPIKVVGPLSKAINAMHFSIALFSVDARPFTGPKLLDRW